jgi:hypothetical protein
VFVDYFLSLTISATAEKRKVAKASRHTFTSLTPIEIKITIVLTSIRANRIVSKAIDFFMALIINWFRRGEPRFEY